MGWVGEDRRAGGLTAHHSGMHRGGRSHLSGNGVQGALPEGMICARHSGARGFRVVSAQQKGEGSGRGGMAPVSGKFGPDSGVEGIAGGV